MVMNKIVSYDTYVPVTLVYYYAHLPVCRIWDATGVCARSSLCRTWAQCTS